MGLTPLSLAALALLNERSMHPYEMYQLLLERQEDRYVKVRPGSLYHSVERLLAAGLVEAIGTEREGNRPERTTYAITPAGRETLVSRVHDMLRTPVNEYPQLPVALGEAHNLPASHVVEDLRAHVEALDEEIAELVGLLHDCRDRDREIYYLASSYSHHVKLAEREWIAHLITRIETKDLPWPPLPH